MLDLSLVKFRTEKGVEEPRQPYNNEPWISQLSLLIADALRTSLPRIFYTQGVEELRHWNRPPL